MQTTRHRLKGQRWLLTALTCFLLIGVVPPWREVVGYYLCGIVERRGKIEIWENTLDMLGGYGSWVDSLRRDQNLLRLAERTNQPHYWLVVAEYALPPNDSEPPNPQFSSGETSVRRALPYFQRAIALDPNDPMLYARVATHCIRAIRFDREEDYLDDPPLERIPSPQFSNDLWSTAVALVQRGKMVDPNNAYFDYLHAYFLFAVKRDTEAFAAVHSGAGKSGFNDYGIDATQLYDRALQAIGLPILERSYEMLLMRHDDPNYISSPCPRIRDVLKYYIWSYRKTGDTAVIDALCADGMAMGAHLRDRGNNFLHAIEGESIQKLFAGYASSSLRDYIARERRKNDILDRHMRAAIDADLKRLKDIASKSSIIGILIDSFKLAVLWFLLWAVLMLILALTIALPARKAPTPATDWRTREIVLLVGVMLSAVLSACVYGWVWSNFAEERLGGKTKTLLPLFAGLLLTLPPVAVVLFALVRAWWLRLQLTQQQRGGASFWRLLWGCLRTASRTAAVTFAVTTVILMPVLTHYRTKATNYLRELPTKERQQMDRWLAALK